ncbi:MAG: deoxyribose-phosphate aldolase [Epulopiscium sp.]|jgi:deoxyribose-phosphate aldolase|nr:deoxyribose-phosphate aldolase [Candidatus Epulonipiscium sp.]
MNYELENVLHHVDHTLLRQTATWQEVQKICEEGIAYQTASVCIPPSYVKKAKEFVQGNIPVCTVIGFPTGYQTTAAKVFEAKDAIENGADEIDMVIHQGLVKDGRYKEIEDEIKAIKAECGNRILKVIVETCMLTQEEKILLCKLVGDSGADFIKTSTGFASGGATLEDVRLFHIHKKGQLQIKASGGIRSLESAKAFLEAGAERLGTSSMMEWIQKINA